LVSTALLFAVAATLALSPHAVSAQTPSQDRPQNPAQAVDAPHPQAQAPPVLQPSPPVKERFLVNKFPDQPSLAPTWSIPVEPLGFSAPGSIYLGSRNSLASLDFLDENRLLFTFRVPGLLHRDAANGQESDERRIRAVVLTLPRGTVEAETLWTVHDRLRYLWMLNNGHFLLRDRNNLLEGDARLVLKPFLDFPGSLLWLELDPAQQFMVTSSREPVARPQKSGQANSPGPPATDTGRWGGSPATASASVTSDEDSAALEGDRPETVLRILRRASGDVLLVSRVRSAVHLPINSLGYLENLRGRGTQWVLNLSYFTGGTRMLGSVDSACEPDDDFVSEQEILVTACGPAGETKLVAMSTEGRTLWVSQAPSAEVWPQLTVAPNGSRLAWATLDVSHAVNSYAPIGVEDVKEQSVSVFDAANGDIAMVSPLSPILDAGGNVAISPSGRRVAVINAGAIQVFELPPPPPLPTPANQRSPGKQQPLVPGP
jgi:hypothetical protein